MLFRSLRRTFRDINPNGAEIGRKELFDLYKYYQSVIKDQLEFCFKYLNFYIGLFLAVLAGTLTGLLSSKVSYPLNYCLALGPMLTIVLCVIGYLNVRVFYRRHIEA